MEARTKRRSHSGSRVVGFATFACLIVSQTAAQSLYIGGTLGADLVGGQDSPGLAGSVREGRTLSGAARSGAEFAERFGVELEVSRAAEIRDGFRARITPPTDPAGPAQTIFIDVDSATRITTLSTTAFIRQKIRGSVTLAYFGGVAFYRIDSKTENRVLNGMPTGDGYVVSGSFTFTPVGSEPAWPVSPVLPSSRSKSVRNGAGPVAGLEAHITRGDHFTITSGVRIHRLSRSWLVRPSVGAGWMF